MSRMLRAEPRGFTLIELLVALIILSLLALASYRGLGSVLEAREYVTRETEKWQRLTLFFARFEHDVRLASPRPVRDGKKTRPAWHARVSEGPGSGFSPYLEFSRLGSTEGMERAQRIAYVYNGKQEIELWLWPGLDVVQGTASVRYPVLTGVTRLELQYLNADLAWADTWPRVGLGPAGSAISSVPHAVRVRIALASGEEIERIFLVKS